MKGILYRLIEAFLNKEISANFFCGEFTIIYTRYDIEIIEEREFGIRLTKLESSVLANISEWCFKYATDEKDIYTGWHITETELKIQVEEELKKLKDQ